jgi:hypothetical protein
MSDKPSTILDIDLTRQDIQSLSSADAFAAFFARLGYNTDARTAQTAGNLGMGLAHPQALARSFRNRAGNYLLILTSDYDRTMTVWTLHFWRSTCGRMVLMAVAPPKALTRQRNTFLPTKS